MIDCTTLWIGISPQWKSIGQKYWRNISSWMTAELSQSNFKAPPQSQWCWRFSTDDKTFLNCFHMMFSHYLKAAFKFYFIGKSRNSSKGLQRHETCIDFFETYQSDRMISNFDKNFLDISSIEIHKTWETMLKIWEHDKISIKKIKNENSWNISTSEIMLQKPSEMMKRKV